MTPAWSSPLLRNLLPTPDSHLDCPALFLFFHTPTMAEAGAPVAETHRARQSAHAGGSSTRMRTTQGLYRLNDPGPSTNECRDCGPSGMMGLCAKQCRTTPCSSTSRRAAFASPPALASGPLRYSPTSWQTADMKPTKLQEVETRLHPFCYVLSILSAGSRSALTSTCPRVHNTVLSHDWKENDSWMDGWLPGSAWGGESEYV